MLERVVIGLENNEADHSIISFVHYWRNLFRQSRLYWAHVSHSLEIPIIQRATYVQEPWDERFQQQIYQMLMEFREDIDISTINILEGNPTEELIHWTDVKRASLLMIGYHPHRQDHEVSINKILRNTGIHIWLVPDQASINTTNILVPVDLSLQSVSAIQQSIDWCSKLDNLPHIHLLHVFDLPYSSNYQTGYQQEELLNHTRSEKEKLLTNSLKEIDWKGITYKTHLLPNIHLNVAKHICEFSSQHSCDTIIMAAKKHHILSSLLLGSVSEQLVDLIEKPSLLIIRPED